MCRMLFAQYCTPCRATTERLVLEFAKLAQNGNVPKGVEAGHRDGWGFVRYADGALITHERYATPIEPVLENILGVHNENSSSCGLLIHLRKASVGGNGTQNSHPFIMDEWSFMHNGTLACDTDGVLETQCAKISGETDSERFFHLILHLVRDKEHPMTVPEAFREVLEKLRKETEYSSASCVLTNGKTVYVLREYNEHHPERDVRGFDEYFTIFMGKGNDGEVIFCSEKLPIEGIEWKLLPNHTLGIFDVETGEYREEGIK